MRIPFDDNRRCRIFIVVSQFLNPLLRVAMVVVIAVAAVGGGVPGSRLVVDSAGSSLGFALHGTRLCSDAYAFDVGVDVDIDWY